MNIVKWKENQRQIYLIYGQVDLILEIGHLEEDNLGLSCAKLRAKFFWFENLIKLKICCKKLSGMDQIRGEKWKGKKKLL